MDLRTRIMMLWGDEIMELGFDVAASNLLPGLYDKIGKQKGCRIAME